MKKRIILTESEREHILNLHVIAKNTLSEQTAAATAVNAYQAQRLQNKAQRQQSRADETKSKASEFASKLPQQQPTQQQPTQQQPESPQQQTTTQQTTQQTTQANNTVQERFKTAKCPGKDTKQGQVCDDKKLQVQIKINDKCPSDKLPIKLAEDGIWGPKSTAAFNVCKGLISGGASTQPQTASVQAPLDAQNAVASNSSSETIDSLSV